MLLLKMIYWLLGFILITAIIIVAAVIKRRDTEKKKLAEIIDNLGLPKVDERNFKQIAGYLTAIGGEFAASSADLDLDEVFTFIDRTSSKPGQQYLYNKLHGHQASQKLFSNNEQLINKFTADPQLRAATELKLSALNNDDAYNLPWLFSQKHDSLFTPLVKAYIRIAALLVLSLAFGIALFHKPVFGTLLMVCIVVNMVIHYSNKKKMLRYIHALPQLLLLITTGEWLLEKGLLEQNDEIKPSLAIVSRLKKAISFINVQSAVADEPTGITYLFTEWLKIILMLEPFNFITSIDKVNKCPGDIRKVFEAVGQVDMAIAIHSVRTGLPHYSIPEFVNKTDELVIIELYHPLVENCVANSVTLDKRQGALITGSNMSGKTTFIRAIALNALLSQTINTSFAKRYKAPPLKILTSINMSDDLGAHTSYYQAEATAIRNIIRDTAASKPLNCLVIIDEIFRGTNTIERIAAAKAVLSWFIENGSFILVSTHDLELAQLLGSDYKVFSFEETDGSGKLVFDYKIREGLLKNKNGITVLKSLDYPPGIIEEASKISMQLREKYDL